MAWSSADKLLETEDKKINYLSQIYIVVQALWAHGQLQLNLGNKDDENKWKFLRSSENAVKETASKLVWIVCVA
jgi:hypothetical protein